MDLSQMDFMHLNFKDTLTVLGQIMSTGSHIIVTVYDSTEGMTILPDVEMDKFDAERLFGEYSVYASEIIENKIRFILNAF